MLENSLSNNRVEARVAKGEVMGIADERCTLPYVHIGFDEVDVLPLVKYAHALAQCATPHDQDAW